MNKALECRKSAGKLSEKCRKLSWHFLSRPLPAVPFWPSPIFVLKDALRKGEWGGKGYGFREAPSSCNPGGWGGPSKGQLGPDPHLRALDLGNCSTVGVRAWIEDFSKGIAKGGVKNRNKGGCKRLFAFVHVCSRLLAFVCVFASAFACVCPCLSAFACVCSHLLTPPFVAPPSAWHWFSEKSSRP